VSEAMPPLDGNAAGGPLARLFARDATSMRVTCNGCGATSFLGALLLYGGRMGMILRCPKCTAVNLRAAEINASLRVDTAGARYLIVKSSSAPPGSA
jgi:predicted nucleic-acid-binding Zn-ribbon protein